MFYLQPYAPPPAKSTKSAPQTRSRREGNKKGPPRRTALIVCVMVLEANDVRGLQALGAISNLELNGYTIFQ
jgi:hypothetical protein